MYFTFPQTDTHQDSFIKDESTWVQEPDSVGQLKLGLWSLESLYKLQNSLDASRKSIDYAKTELMVQVQNVGRIRSFPTGFLTYLIISGSLQEKSVIRENVRRVFGNI